jgi:hypothetical protein
VNLEFLLVTEPFAANFAAVVSDVGVFRFDVHFKLPLSLINHCTIVERALVGCFEHVSLVDVPRAAASRFELSRAQIAIPVIVGCHDLMRSHMRF